MREALVGFLQISKKVIRPFLLRFYIVVELDAKTFILRNLFKSNHTLKRSSKANMLHSVDAIRDLAERETPLCHQDLSTLADTYIERILKEIKIKTIHLMKSLIYLRCR